MRTPNLPPRERSQYAALPPRACDQKGTFCLYFSISVIQIWYFGSFKGIRHACVFWVYVSASPDQPFLWEIQDRCRKWPATGARAASKLVNMQTLRACGPSSTKLSCAETRRSFPTAPTWHRRHRKHLITLTPVIPPGTGWVPQPTPKTQLLLRHQPYMCQARSVLFAACNHRFSIQYRLQETCRDRLRTLV